MIFSLLNSEKICRKKEGIKTTTSQIYCSSTLLNIRGSTIYSFTFILARIKCFMSSDICFTSFICSFIVSS